MDGLARFWAPALRRMVINRTGLDGYFDGEFDPTAEFGPPPPPPGMPDPFDRASFPSAFTVLREQLGLGAKSPDQSGRARAKPHHRPKPADARHPPGKAQPPRGHANRRRPS